MAINYAKLFNRRVTPQSLPIPGTNQVRNSNSGYSWQVDDWTRLDRFLILGAEGGTYYIGERELVKQNHDALIRCIKADGVRAVNRIVEISDAGRAPKNDPAIFALALVVTHGDAPAKAHAFANLNKVCRIGTHLFHFAEYVNAMRGWGRGLRNAVGRWYVDRGADDLAHQAVKYQQRDGWSHADLLRLAHPKAPSAQHDAVFRWMLTGADALGEREVKRKVRGEDRVAKYASVGELPKFIGAFERVKSTTNVIEVVKLIDEFDLPREAIPTQWLTVAGGRRRSFQSRDWLPVFAGRHAELLEASPDRFACCFETTSSPIRALERLSREHPGLVFLLQYETTRCMGLARAKAGRLVHHRVQT